MSAIVEIAGQQFKDKKDQQLFVHRLENKEGESVSFDRVLLIDNDGKVNVGAPAISGASVTAKVLEHMKGDKTIVFKKKRRKGYKKKKGHRQYMTSIQVESISEKGGAKTAAKAKPAEEKKETKAKKEEGSEKKKASTAKKTTAKKSTSEKKSTSAKKSTSTKKASGDSAKKASSSKEKSTSTKKSSSTKKEDKK